MRSMAYITDLISEGAIVVLEEFETAILPGEDSLASALDYFRELYTLTWHSKFHMPSPRLGQHCVYLVSSSRAVLVSQERPLPAAKTVFLMDLGSPVLELLHPIPVTLQYGEDSVTACAYDLEDFGSGTTEFEALDDIKATIVDLYFLLKKESDRLGPHPEKQWRLLQSITKET